MADSRAATRKGQTSSLESGQWATPVTPDDSADIAAGSRALYIGVSGDLHVLMKAESADADVVIFKDVPVGMLDIAVRRVMEATTATDIVAVY